MTVAAVTGDTKAVDFVRDVNLQVNAPFSLSALTNEGLYEIDLTESSVDHGLLGGLSDDDHTGYALLIGRSGGQTLIGGVDGADDLTLQSTSDGTKGQIIFGTGGLVFDEVLNQLQFSDANTSITAESGDMILDVATTKEFHFDIATVTEVILSEDKMHFGGGVALNWENTGVLIVEVADVDEYEFDSNAFYPSTTDIDDLGKAANRWDGVYAQFVNPSHLTDPASVIGNIWYNETSNKLRAESDSGKGDLQITHAVLETDHQVANTTTETEINVSHTMPEDTAKAGKVWILEAWGILTTDATITYTLRFKVGTTTFISFAQSQTSVTNGEWHFKGQFTIQSVTFGTASCKANAHVGIPRDESTILGNSAAVTYDSTITEKIALTVKMSVASIGKHITCQQLTIREAA